VSECVFVCVGVCVCLHVHARACDSNPSGWGRRWWHGEERMWKLMVGEVWVFLEQLGN
jgi:hypothetical protein